MATLEVVVTAIDTHDTPSPTLRLEDGDGRPLPAFQAAAYIDVYLPDRRVRKYALSSDPADRSHYRIRVPLDDAAQALLALAPGARIRISMPRSGAVPGDARGDEAAVPDGAPFRVRLASTGALYDIPADRSVADVLQEAGVDVLVLCEQGACGTCITRVLGGEPDHRDIAQSPAEQASNRYIALCCSRSKSAVLTLDL